VTQAALPPDVPGSRFAITPRTLVPIGVVAIAFALGVALESWKGAEEADVTRKLVDARVEVTALGVSVQLARAEIMAKLDSIAASVVADHAIMMTKEDFDNVWRLAKALNPTVIWPDRAK
jgi:hypothetical protein